MIKAHKLNILNIPSVAFLFFLWVQAIGYYLDAATCLSYNVVWDFCRNETFVALTILFVVTGVNIINFWRLLKRKNDTT